LLSPALFYGGFEFAANLIVQQYELPRQTRNGVKHALTAAVAFKTLRQLYVADAAAEHIILSLGAFNEHVETYVKVGNFDSEAEMRKDLYNNWAGIVAARWILEQPERRDFFSTLAMLAQSGTLMLKPLPDTSPATMEAPEVSRAQGWLAAHQQQFAIQMNDALNNQSRPRQK